MPYRKLDNSVIWHWCRNCSSWPLEDFGQREDKPPTWTGQSLCEECATRDHRADCQHSVELTAGSELQAMHRLLDDFGVPPLQTWEDEGGATFNPIATRRQIAESR